MGLCIDTNDKRFRALLAESGIKSKILQAKVATWQETYNTNAYPTLEEILKSPLTFKEEGSAEGYLDRQTLEDQLVKSKYFGRHTNKKDGVQRVFVRAQFYAQAVNEVHTLKQKHPNLGGISIKKARNFGAGGRTIHYVSFPPGFDNQTPLLFDDAPASNYVTVSDLRRTGQFRGTKVTFVAEIESSRSTPVAMRNIGKGKEILINEELMRQKYADKAWMHPATLKDGSKAEPLLENIFPTFNAFLSFALLHEKMHEKYHKDPRETIGQYETRINNRALSAYFLQPFAHVVDVENPVTQMTPAIASVLEKQLMEFARRNGIKIRSTSVVINILKKQGRIQGDPAGLGGIADAYNKLIGIADGASTEILGEEMSHLVIAMLGLDHPLIAPALAEVQNTPEYDQHFQGYVEEYQARLGMTELEAMDHANIEVLGKVLTSHLGQQTREEVLTKDRLARMSKLERLLNYIWDHIIGIFSKPEAKVQQTLIQSTMGTLATKIKNGEVIANSRTSDIRSIWFNIEKKEAKVAADMIKSLNLRIERMNNKLKEHDTSVSTVREIQAQKTQLKGMLDAARVDAAVTKYLVDLDKELIEKFKENKTPDGKITMSKYDIADNLDFIGDHTKLISTLATYMEELNEEGGLDIVNIEDFRIVLEQANKSLNNLEGITNREYIKFVDAELHKADPVKWPAGSISETIHYQRDAGLVKGLQTFTGSVRHASNNILKVAFQLVNDVDNIVKDEEAELKSQLMPLQIAAEEAGFDFNLLFEKYADGSRSGNLTTSHNFGKVDERLEKTKADLVKKFQVDTYDDVKAYREDIVGRIEEYGIEHLPTEDTKWLAAYRHEWNKFNEDVYDYSKYTSIRISEHNYDLIDKAYEDTELNIHLKGTHKKGDVLNLASRHGKPSSTFFKVISLNTNGDAVVRILEDPSLGISDKYKNKDYDRIKNLPFYKAYATALQKYKGFIPYNQRANAKHWRLPQKMASQLELQRTGQWNKIPERVKQSFYRTVDEDVDGRESFLGLDGKVMKFYPTYYTEKLDDMSLLTGDFTGTLLKFAGMAKRFQELNKRDPEFKMLQKFLGEAVFDTKPKPESGVNTQSYKMLEHFYSAYLYGETQPQLGLVTTDKDKRHDKGKLAVDKILQTAYNLIQDAGLMFSVPIAVAGFVKGNIDQFIERQVGEYISNESWTYGIAEGIKHSTGILADMGARVKRNKIAVLLEYTDIAFPYSDRLLNVKNKAARTSLKEVGYSVYSVDIKRKSELLIGVLDNLRYIDGVLYDRQDYREKFGRGKDVDSKWKAARKDSMYNKMTVKDGKIEGIPTADLHRFRNIIKDLNPRFEGTIGHLEKGKIHHHSLGQFAKMYRNWMIRGVQDRAKSHGKNPYTGRDEEGTYVTLFRFIGGIFKNYHNQGQRVTMKTFWSDLKPYEQRNMMRVGVDMAFTLAVMVLTAAANAAADDDDKKDNWFTQYQAYQLSRIMLEQQAFWNVTEIFSMLNSPAAGIATVEDIFAIPGMLFDWDPIQSGPYKGATKAERMLWKRLWFKNLYEIRFPREKNNWLRNNVLKTGLNGAFYEPLEDSFNDE